MSNLHVETESELSLRMNRILQINPVSEHDLQNCSLYAQSIARQAKRNTSIEEWLKDLEKVKTDTANFKAKNAIRISPTGKGDFTFYLLYVYIVRIHSWDWE